jgi:hypothetical protein
MTTSSKNIVIISTVSLIATCTAAAAAYYYYQNYVVLKSCQSPNNMNEEQTDGEFIDVVNKDQKNTNPQHQDETLSHHAVDKQAETVATEQSKEVDTSISTATDETPSDNSADI